MMREETKMLLVLLADILALYLFLIFMDDLKNLLIYLLK